MDRLPVELIEQILSYLDGYTLIKATTVCTVWRDVAKIFDKNQAHWKNLCFTEISRHVLLELTINKYPFWRPNSKNQEVNWKDLYMAWLNWKLVRKFKYHVDVISEHKPGYVTCLKLVGESIVVGLHNGEISTWKSLCGEPIVIAKHRNRVTCLEVLSLLDERKESEENKQLRYIISTSHDRRVKVSYLINEGMNPKDFDLCQHNCSTICVRVQQSYFAILDSNGTVSVWLVDPPKSSGIMPTIHFVANYLPQSTSAILSLGLWGGMVTGMTKNGVVLNADFFESKDIMTIVYSPENQTVHITVVEDGRTYLTQVNHHLEIGISKCYNWRNQIFLWITDTLKILISLNGYNYFEYDTEKALKSRVKSVLLYGNILFLGMETGSVYMYYFDKPEDLLNMDLKLFHWHHPVAKTPIIGMDIYEDPSGPLLAVLSNSFIHLVDWTVTLEDIIEDE